MDRFSTLIICEKCKKKFKTKKERGKVKYLCSGYERFGKDYCERNILKEEDLNNMIQHKFKRNLTDTEIRDLIEEIKVDGKSYEIIYKDGTTQEVQENYIKFL